VSATDAPVSPEHFRFSLNHIKDEARTNRDASLAPNTIFCDHHRRIHLAFHHSDTSVFPKAIRKQNGEYKVELR
jgi:hypothetical protein